MNKWTTASDLLRLNGVSDLSEDDVKSAIEGLITKGLAEKMSDGNVEFYRLTNDGLMISDSIQSIPDNKSLN